MSVNPPCSLKKIFVIVKLIFDSCLLTVYFALQLPFALGDIAITNKPTQAIVLCMLFPRLHVKDA